MELTLEQRTLNLVPVELFLICKFLASLLWRYPKQPLFIAIEKVGNTNRLVLAKKSLISVMSFGYRKTLLLDYTIENINGLWKVDTNEACSKLTILILYMM